ncbi:hypothetical protein IscW_ISCW014281 [Ixodes scapularis]|uniref:Uncharacterized protein n=1 Tax=Ixodes scapularis TaxID=6945 RepID=B7QKV0_IXOSC|nr:hypothetical protein IscW_ISCW014281 [Ixodes scapularis]|eukprot:XP_002415805.1 hypothetical protein IscW_ISCW014281 [Ixodes scapularis]
MASSGCEERFAKPAAAGPSRKRLEARALRWPRVCSVGAAGVPYETDGKDMQAVVPERTAWPPWPGPTSGRTEGALRGQGALDGVVRSVPVREPAGRAWATPLPPRRGPPQRPSSRLGDPLSEATRAAAPAHADVHAGGTTGGRPADHAGTNHSNTRLFRASVDTEI